MHVNSSCDDVIDEVLECLSSISAQSLACTQPHLSAGEVHASNKTEVKDDGVELLGGLELANQVQGLVHHVEVQAGIPSRLHMLR